LVFSDYQPNEIEDENFYPNGRSDMKKHRSAAILREASISPRKTGSPSDSTMMTSSSRIYRTSKPSLTSTNISPSKVREKIRQANSVKNFERGSKSLPRKVSKESKLKHRDEFEFFGENLDQFSWSDSD